MLSNEHLQMTFAMGRSIAAVAVLFVATSVRAADPLPSWQDGPAKKAVISFVEMVTAEGRSGFVPPSERIAVFDNDGTLWVEQPMYTQLAFALDRIKAMAPEHPEWSDQEPFKSALAGDVQAVAASGMEGGLKIIAATHAGMTSDEFAATVLDWLKTARHPKFDRPYLECVYQPQLELLNYLRENGFKTFIVSGGGVDFMRPWTEAVYDVPPEQVVGSSGKTKFELQDGKPVILKEAGINFIDDKAGKPVGIQRFIGRRPILAVGNSDGDQQMLEYTTIENPRPNLGILVHHTDAQREYAYDRDSHIGQLDKALDEATKRGWIVVDMKEDWSRIFPSPVATSIEPTEQVDRD